MSYDYTARDLMEGPPFHYMFSPFEGLSFLGDYVSTRKADLLRLGAGSDAPPAGTAGDVPALGASGFETEPLLGVLVGAAREGRIHRDWIDMFLRKFEAAKRLRRSYDSHLKITDRDPVGRLAYARLAYLAASALSEPRDFRRLNALLKLNDLVLSAPDLPQEALTLVSRSVARELDCVTALMRAQSLELSKASP